MNTRKSVRLHRWKIAALIRWTKEPGHTTTAMLSLLGMSPNGYYRLLNDHRAKVFPETLARIDAFLAGEPIAPGPAYDRGTTEPLDPKLMSEIRQHLRRIRMYRNEAAALVGINYDTLSDMLAGRFLRTYKRTRRQAMKILQLVALPERWENDFRREPIMQRLDKKESNREQ